MSTASQVSATNSASKKFRTQRVPREFDREHSSPDWSSYAQLMSEYDDAMIRGWKEEIDTLLVFAGLFSAAVTAFNIEAYKLLQDPFDITPQLLQQILQQLQAQGPNVTTSIGATQAGGRPIFRPSGQSIRINALWFASLVCALFSALICIMVKQWLREYMAMLPLSPRHSVRLRQHRHDGLIGWRVPELMALLPILLELSLILFLAGLVDFLLLFNSTVAATTTSLVTVALLFYLGTTLAPVLSTQCPFKSPQSWLLFRAHRRFTEWAPKIPTPWVSPQQTRPMPKFANWNERDNSAVWSRHDELDLRATTWNSAVWSRHDELDLRATTWIHASFVDDDIQDSLIPVISELKPSHATFLVFTVIADKMGLSTSTFIRFVRARSCSSTLRDACTRLGRRTRRRMFDMLLKLLVHIPRDQDPSELGALDALWVLWELCLGACNADDEDPYLHQSILNGVAELLGEHEPFRLRRAALNLLYESTHAWTYLHCPSGIGNIIAFARTCCRHGIADTFVKASAVVLLLSQWLDWNDDEAMPHHRQQLKGLLRDLARFLRQCNEDGRRYDERSAGKLVCGIALLAEKDGELVSKMLPRVLLEGAELGLLDLTHEDRVMLRGM